MEKPALLIVDLQNDFCPGGALGVADGDRVVAPLSRLAALFAERGLPVLASRDWHPAMTRHFREYGGQWPPHCIAGTPGAAFHPDLHLPEGTVILSKGIDPERDSYSAFEAVSEEGMTLKELLVSLGVTRLYIGGLATDYCVRCSALDGLRLGLKITVIEDATAGVDLNPWDSRAAIAEVAGAGAELTTVAELVEKLRA